MRERDSGKEGEGWEKGEAQRRQHGVSRRLNGLHKCLGRPMPMPMPMPRGTPKHPIEDANLTPV